MSSSTTGSNQSRTPSAGPFFFTIDNLPLSYSWQDLKDLVKRVAAHGVWTDVVLVAGRPCGYARISRKEEAYSLYAYLIHPKRVDPPGVLSVHLWDTSNPDAHPALIVSNCAESCRKARHMRNTDLAVKAVVPVSPLPAAPAVPAMSFSYVSKADGRLVNTSQGYVQTECRGVFISNLSFKVTTEELRKLFGRDRNIVQCEIHMDRKGKSKGKATVVYASVKDAHEAIESLDNMRLYGMRITVRGDKEEQPVFATPSRSSVRTGYEPIIVNGSGRGS